MVPCLLPGTFGTFLVSDVLSGLPSGLLSGFVAEGDFSFLVSAVVSDCLSLLVCIVR